MKMHIDYASAEDLLSRIGAESNMAIASRLIKNAISKGLIKPFDPSAATKSMSYVPYWF